jgi:hypothetical protein
MQCTQHADDSIGRDVASRLEVHSCKVPGSPWLQSSWKSMVARLLELNVCRVPGRWLLAGVLDVNGCMYWMLMVVKP